MYAQVRPLDWVFIICLPFVPCNGPVAQVETCILVVFSHWKAGMAGVCQQFSQSADRGHGSYGPHRIRHDVTSPD